MISRPALVSICFCLTALALTACDRSSEVVQSASSKEPADVLGEVSFPTSCDESVQGEFDSAVATLHSFEFEEARGMFESIAAQDPACAWRTGAWP